MTGWQFKESREPKSNAKRSFCREGYKISCDDCDVLLLKRMDVQTKFIEQCLIAFADKIMLNDAKVS